MGTANYGLFMDKSEVAPYM